MLNTHVWLVMPHSAEVITAALGLQEVLVGAAIRGGLFRLNPEFLTLDRTTPTEHLPSV